MSLDISTEKLLPLGRSEFTYPTRLLKYSKGDLFHSKNNEKELLEIQESMYEGYVYFKKTETKNYFGFQGYLVYNHITQKRDVVSEEYITENFVYKFNCFD